MISRSSQPADQKIVAEGLTFDDLLLLPREATFGRDQADMTTKLHPKVVLKIPIISSPMDTVTEEKMAMAMAEAGGLGIIHRNLSIAKQADMVRVVKKRKLQTTSLRQGYARQASYKLQALDAQGHLLVGAAVGVGPDFDERILALIQAKCDVIVVDTAHGHSTLIVDAVKAIKKKSKSQVVMAGNVATAEGAKALVKAGADILRVGMGPGAICTTRVVTGVGVPQMTAIFEVVKGVKGVRGGKGVTIIADGGIKQMGDIAKALGAGAHAVMLGSMLAGYRESPGEIIEVDGQKMKKYRGMGSVAAMSEGSASRYGQKASDGAKKLIAEGVEGAVPFKGDVAEFLHQAAGSLRSSMYYLGSKTIEELRKNAQFVRITHASLKESHPHSIVVTEAGGNYRA